MHGAAGAFRGDNRDPALFYPAQHLTHGAQVSIVTVDEDAVDRLRQQARPGVFIVFLGYQHDDVLAVEQVVNKAWVEPPDVVGNDDENRARPAAYFRLHIR